MTGKSKTEYRSVSMALPLFEAIEDYRFEHRIKSMAKAVDLVLRKGLEALASENSDGANRLVAESPVAEEHPAV